LGKVRCRGCSGQIGSLKQCISPTGAYLLDDFVATSCIPARHNDADASRSQCLGNGLPDAKSRVTSALRMIFDKLSP
jgi:hypothetical protein